MFAGPGQSTSRIARPIGQENMPERDPTIPKIGDVLIEIWSRIIVLVIDIANFEWGFLYKACCWGNRDESANYSVAKTTDGKSPFPILGFEKNIVANTPSKPTKTSGQNC
jgi:hypothetical protein